MRLVWYFVRSFSLYLIFIRTGSHSLEAKSKPKKIALPLFGAMKGGSKFKLKTGSLGVSWTHKCCESEAISQTPSQAMETVGGNRAFSQAWNQHGGTSLRQWNVHRAASSGCWMLFAASICHSMPLYSQFPGAQLQSKVNGSSRGSLRTSGWTVATPQQLVLYFLLFFLIL